MPEFKDIVASINGSGKSRTMTVRELIQSVGKERRGKYVSRSLRNKLKYNKLMTEPDFEAVHIDAVVTVKQLVQALPSPRRLPLKLKRVPQVTPVVPQHIEALIDPDPVTPRDAVVTIRQGIPSARKTPPSVRSDVTTKMALSRLMMEKLDLLVVQNGDRARVEGIFSYASFTHAYVAGKPTKTVADCTSREFIEVNEEKPLIDAVRDIMRHGTIVVRSRQNQLCGVVSARDVAPVFVELAEPFLLLGQIENHLRSLLERAKLKKDDYKKLVVEADAERSARAESPDDLPLGELIVAFESEALWGNIGLQFDKATFKKLLHSVREIRNKVMHFSPDGLPPENVEKLKKVRELLEKL